MRIDVALLIVVIATIGTLSFGGWRVFGMHKPTTTAVTSLAIGTALVVSSLFVYLLYALQVLPWHFEFAPIIVTLLTFGSIFVPHVVKHRPKALTVLLAVFTSFVVLYYLVVLAWILIGLAMIGT